MKIQPTNNYQTGKLPAQRQSFKGMGSSLGDAVIKTMDAIAMGGLAASFMSQDFFGLCLPRTIAGLFVGRDGEKYNYKNALEEALREFITGPSMFLIPIACLGFIAKYLGGAATLTVSSIKDFGSMYKEVLSQMCAEGKINKEVSGAISAANIKETFYKRVFTQIRMNNNLPEKIDGEKFEDVFTKRVLELEQYSIRGRRFGWLFNSGVREDNATYKRQLAQIVKDIAELNKRVLNPSDDPLNVKVRITKSKNKSTTLSIEKVIKRIEVYAADAVLNLKDTVRKSGMPKNISDFVENFNLNRIGKRIMGNIAITAFVAGFMLIIPKLYQVSDTNPKTDVLKQKFGGNGG